MASRSWNRVELIGNLTRDPELRYTPNGAAVCTLGLATNRTFVTDGEKREEVDFHRLVAWNKLAELCNQLLKKGTRIFVSGRLQTRSWEGQDGQTRQTTEVVIEDMIILTPKGDVSGASVAENVTEEIPTRVEVEAVQEKATPAVETPPAEPESTPSEEQEEKKPPKAPKEDIDPDSDLPF